MLLGIQADDFVEKILECNRLIDFHKNRKNSQLKKLGEIVLQMSEKGKVEFVNKYPFLVADLALLKVKEEGEGILGGTIVEYQEVLSFTRDHIRKGKSFTSDAFANIKKQALKVLIKLF